MKTNNSNIMTTCAIEAIARIYLRPKPDGASLERTEFTFSVSSNMDKSQYMDKDERPTKIGSHAVTQAFIQGLAGNIHFAHQAGFRDSAEHLRYIIKELERSFATPASVEHSEMEPIQ